MTQERPGTVDQQDVPQTGRSTSEKPDGGAFLAIGLAFFVIGLTQLAGDHASSSIVYLVVGAVFMAMSARMNLEKAAKARRGPGAARADGSDAHPDTPTGDASDGQG